VTINAHIAIASGSSCVVPSVEEILPSTVIKSLDLHDWCYIGVLQNGEEGSI